MVRPPMQAIKAEQRAGAHIEPPPAQTQDDERQDGHPWGPAASVLRLTLALAKRAQRVSPEDNMTSRYIYLKVI